MTRTVLFFGDSNTRGFGLMPQHRYAAVLERSLEGVPAGQWQFVVVAAASDLRTMGGKLEAALTRHRPDVLVVQCPTGPASYFIKYPPWLNLLRSLPARHLRWRKERAIAAELEEDQTHRRTRRDVLLDGHYVDSVYRFRLGKWAALRALREAAGRRYGVVVKATGARYLERMLQMRAMARAAVEGPILFFGLLPVSDSLYPGYHQRAREWNAELAKHLPDSAQRCSYVDVMEPLAALPSGDLLLSDESHFNVDGHRRIAALLLPELRRLIEEVESGQTAST